MAKFWFTIIASCARLITLGEYYFSSKSLNEILRTLGKMKTAVIKRIICNWLTFRHIYLATLQLKQFCFCGDWINPFFGGNSGMIWLCLLACCTVGVRANIWLWRKIFSTVTIEVAKIKQKNSPASSTYFVHISKGPFSK